MFADWKEHELIENGLRSLAAESCHLNVGELIDYVLTSPGKRVRPLILLISAEAFGCEAERALDAALAVELAHAASLIHDDILDCGIERRGIPSAVKKFGVEASLLGGDYLISMSIGLISSYGEPAIRLFSKACMDMAEGEMIDLSRITSPVGYYQCVTKKTAALFAAAAKLGCLIAGATPLDQSLYERYGLGLGIAYQIVDDLEEIIGVDQGKRSAKKSSTLPRIYSMTYSQEEAIQRCLDAVGEHANDARDSLLSAGGDPEMKERLLMILSRMTESMVKRCSLQSPLC